MRFILEVIITSNIKTFFIAANQFEDASQSIHLENINGLTLNQEQTKIKIKSIDVKNISN